MLEVSLAGGNKVLRHWRWLRLRPTLVFNLIHDASSFEETVWRDLKFVWCLWAARGSCLCLPLFLNVSRYLSQSVSTAGSTAEDGDANLSSTLLLPVILANIFEFYK